MTDITVLDRRATVASFTPGMSPDRVRIVNMELDVLFNQGARFPLSVHQSDVLLLFDRLLSQ